MWQLLVAAICVLLQHYTSWTFTLPEILQRSHQELNFETLLLLQHSQQRECQQLQQIAVANWSLLRFSQLANDLQLRGKQSCQMLALMCLTGQEQQDMQLWQTLAKNLDHMRELRLILLLPQQQQQVQFEKLAQLTYELHFPHVVLLANETAYQLQPYESTHWLVLEANNSRQSIFKRQYNFHGQIAYAMPDQITIRSFVYWNKKTQKLEMFGFVARLIQELARLHNITLKLQAGVVAGKQVSLVYLRNMTLAGELSFPITLVGFDIHGEHAVSTYPYELGQWFILVPCGQEVTTANVYRMVWNCRSLVVLFSFYMLFTLLDFAFSYIALKRKPNWTYLILNERMISGIVGQSFNLSVQCMYSSRMAHAQLFLFGLVFSTIFTAHLRTLLTKRPFEDNISNFEELRDSKLSVYFEEGERFYANRAMSRGPNLPIKLIEPQIQYINTHDFYKERRILNNSYAQSMLSIDWQIVTKQQELFTQPAFCFEPGLIFSSNIQLSLPLQANSIYTVPLNELIHWVHSVGVAHYWRREALQYLISLGEISLEDLHPEEQFHDFKIRDFFWIWMSLILGLFLSLITFLCEILVSHLSKIT